ncbi:MaoC family dehydratase [Thermodesulfobacteriota bacterium]
MLNPIEFDKIRIGATFGPVTLIADEKLVKQYCDDYGDHNPIYFEKSPFGGPVAPPAFWAGRQGQKTLGTQYDMHATVPNKSTHIFVNPAKIGAVLTTHGKLIAKYIKRGREHVVVESSTIDQGGVQIRQSIEHFILRMERKETLPAAGQEKVVTTYGLEKEKGEKVVVGKAVGLRYN